MCLFSPLILGPALAVQSYEARDAAQSRGQTAGEVSVVTMHYGTQHTDESQG